MKKSLLLVFILSIIHIEVFSQNAPVTESGPAGNITNNVPVPPDINAADMNTQLNKVTTHIPFIPVTSMAGLGSSEKVYVEYKDGNNQTLQAVEHNAALVNGQAKDLVQINDNRVQVNGVRYLPYAINSTSNSLVNTIFTDQKDYYNTNFSNEGYTSFAENIYTSDANSRKITSYAPGKSNVGQQRGTTVQKSMNAASSVKLWGLDANNLPVCTGYYAANAITVTTITDPSSKITKAYVDKDNKLLEKQVSESQSGSTITYQTTWYIYDDLGNLQYIVTPKGVDAIGAATTISATILKNLCFQYRYDAQGRLTQFEKPGEQDFTDIVYDNKNRVVMYRSPLEKSMGKWEVAYYDQLDRSLGYSVLASSQTRDYWQNKIDTQVPANNTDITWYIAGNVGEGTVPADNAVTGNEVMQATFYDDYANGDDPYGNVYNAMYNDMNFTPDLLSGNGAETPSRSLRVYGMPIGEKVKILPGDGIDPASIGTWAYSNFYYDDKGRMIYHDTYDDGTPYSHLREYGFQYDFLNRLILEKQVNNNTQAAAGTITRHTELLKNTYEIQTGNLSGTKHKIDDGPWKGLANYSYNDLGRVSTKVIGDGAEQQDYEYNIRGQLKSINGYYVANGDAQNASRSFGEILSYDYGFTQKQYDGKASGMLWRGTGATEHAYGYSYDKAGRLAAANYTERYEANATEGTWSNTSSDYTVTGVSYDRNGNITSLSQRGMGVVNTGGGPVMQPVDMDQLTYTYEANSNRLLKVTDAISNHTAYDFKDGTNSGNDYAYDNSGNLNADLNKGISSITYTFFNRPSVISFTNGSKITYSYNADGTKIQELFHDAVNSVDKKTSYMGNFVFENDSLQYALTTEGRTIIDPVQANKNTEQFFIKDHLGNVRSVMETAPMPLVPYLATYEMASANTESLLFDKIGEIRTDKPGGGGDDTKAGMLNGAVDSLITGTSLMLKVMAGDEVEMQVDNYYDNYDPHGDIPLQVGDIMHDLVTSLAHGISSIGQREGISGTTISGMLLSSGNINSLTHVMDSITDPTRPSAYLTYMQFDQTMKLVQGGTGAYQVTGDGSWTIIGTNGVPVKILEDGYIIVTIHDRSERPVWFDRLQVLFHRGKLKEETHYYPHGLPMANIGSAAAGMIPNDFRYQTNQFSQNAGLNWMDFGFRQYDPQIGRFLGIDPLADGYGQEGNSPFAAMWNNPVSITDPNGLGWIGNFLNWLDDLFDNTYTLEEVVITASRDPMGTDHLHQPIGFLATAGGWHPSAGGGGANRPPADAGTAYAQADKLNTQTVAFINSLVPFPIATPLNSISTTNTSNYTTNFESENNQEKNNWIESVWNDITGFLDSYEISGDMHVSYGVQAGLDYETPLGQIGIQGNAFSMDIMSIKENDIMNGKFDPEEANFLNSDGWMHIRQGFDVDGIVAGASWERQMKSPPGGGEFFDKKVTQESNIFGSYTRNEYYQHSLYTQPPPPATISNGVHFGFSAALLLGVKVELSIHKR